MTNPNPATAPAPNAIGVAPFNAHDRNARTENELIMRRRADSRASNVPASNASSSKVQPAPSERQPEASAAPNIVPVKLPPAPSSASAATTAVTRPQPTVMVREGDTLSKIAMRLYGSFEEDDVREDVSRIRAANPQIKNANLIYPGQSIRVQQASK